MGTLAAMAVHDHEFAGSSFKHQSLHLGVKHHRRLIRVDDRIERDGSFVSVRAKNNLESPRSPAPHGPSS